MSKTVIEARPKSTKLTRSKEEARQAINKQLEKAKVMQQLQINTEEELTEAQNNWSKLVKYIEELLLTYFDNDYFEHEFTTSYGLITMMPGQELNNLANDMNAKITTLESILERLDLVPEPNVVASPLIKTEPIPKSRDVFIVHGHDQITKLKVADFIRKMGLNPIILHDQADEGKTVIEKLESEAVKAGYAIILVTADDMGHKIGDEANIKPRARQNVLMELGMFVGLLGRKNVRVLLAPGVELPSDLLGVLYTPIGEGWELSLGKELYKAGMPIDPTNIFS